MNPERHRRGGGVAGVEFGGMLLWIWTTCSNEKRCVACEVPNRVLGSLARMRLGLEEGRKKCLIVLLDAGRMGEKYNDWPEHRNNRVSRVHAAGVLGLALGYVPHAPPLHDLHNSTDRRRRFSHLTTRTDKLKRRRVVLLTS